MFRSLCLWFSGFGAGTAACIAATVYNSSLKDPGWDPIPGYGIAVFQLFLAVAMMLMADPFQSQVDYLTSRRES